MRVAIVDDSSLFRNGLAALLTEAGVEVAAEGATADEIIGRLALDPPDAVILDVRLPPTYTQEGIAAAERIRRDHPGIGVLLLSTYAVTAYAAQLLDRDSRGVGYLLKDNVSDVPALCEAIGRVIQGDAVIDRQIVARLMARERWSAELAPLSERERAVLGLMAEGRSNAAIGQRLHLSPRTVEGHIARLFQKLGLPDAPDDNRRVLAVLRWLRGEAAGE
ncbi:MAG: response regulator transcription factor [Chloroflexi bacterium]|nr:MAG: response regulator transcription factor [Chloroflexota bacterium]